jgi:hypothetical protein
VELDKMRAKQQKADTVAKLGLMASKEISNSQVELIRLTAEVTNALDAAWGSIDTINHMLLVCDVADKQVGVMESAMQAAMGGHVSVAAFTELDYARVALKIDRDASAVGLDLVARHLSDYLQMKTSFVAGPAGFSTMVHVPLIDMKLALTIWEHHILPILLDHGLYLNMGPAEYTHLEVLDIHHYMTVPIVVLIIFVGGTILVIMGVRIARRSTDARHQFQMMDYMHKRQNAFERTLTYLEEREAKMNPERPEKATAPQPTWDRVTAGPPPYAGQGRGRPPVSSGPGCPLGATSSLIAEMQEHARTTTGHSLGMNETELHGAGARALGAFDIGRNQEAARNYPRAQAAINMQEMMERK